MNKRLSYGIAIIATVIVSGIVSLWATIEPAVAAQTAPYKINFQGKLTNASGTPLANGVYNMRFRLYSVLSGGTASWSEDRVVSSGTGVTVSDGLFTVQLGDVTALTTSQFTSYPLYLEVELPTPATATCSTAACASYTEGAMTPRNPLGSSAYAMNADTIDGIDGASLAQVGSNNTFTGNNTFKNTTNSTAAFSIQNAASANLLVADTTNSRIYIGDPVANATATFLVLDSSTAASDPSGINGAMYYSTNSGKFRCFEGGLWKDCISTGTSGTTTVKMTSDVINNNAKANTLQDATGLSFAVTAGNTYRFTTFIEYTAAATTTGSRWTVTGPASSLTSAYSFYTLTAASQTTNFVGGYSLPAAANASSLTTGNVAVVDGRVRPTASGVVKIQFASEVANSAITAKAGSTLTWWQE